MSDIASLARGLAEMGIDLPEAAREKLVAYAALRISSAASLPSRGNMLMPILAVTNCSRCSMAKG